MPTNNKPTKDKIIVKLIAISHELDWSYFWHDAVRNKRAKAELEEVKKIIKCRYKKIIL